MHQQQNIPFCFPCEACESLQCHYSLLQQSTQCILLVITALNVSTYPLEKFSNTICKANGQHLVRWYTEILQGNGWKLTWWVGNLQQAAKNTISKQRGYHVVSTCTDFIKVLKPTHHTRVSVEAYPHHITAYNDTMQLLTLVDAPIAPAIVDVVCATYETPTIKHNTLDVLQLTLI